MAGGKAATCLRDDSLLFFSASLPVPEVAAALVQSPSRPFRGGKSAPAVSSPPSIWSNNQCHYCRVIAVGNEDIFTRLPRLSLIRKIAGCLYYSASLWHFSVASRVLGLQWNADGHRAKMGSTGLSGVFVLPCFQLGCWERERGKRDGKKKCKCTGLCFWCRRGLSGWMARILRGSSRGFTKRRWNREKREKKGGTMIWRLGCYSERDKKRHYNHIQIKLPFHLPHPNFSSFLFLLDYDSWQESQMWLCGWHVVVFYIPSSISWLCVALSSTRPLSRGLLLRVAKNM